MKIPKILRPSRKKIIILIALMILGGIGFNFLKPKAKEPLQSAEVKVGQIRQSVASSGILTGQEVVDLKFKSSGKLAYLKVKAGDTVSKYQSIAGLDTTLLNIDLQQAQNSLRDKQAAAEKAEDDVKDNDDDESYAQRQTRTTAQVARDNAYDDVKAAQKALQDAHLISPIAGIVTQAQFIAGQNVSVSDLIAQIADISAIYFDTDVDEADIGKIALGQKAEVTLDAYPNQIFRGEVAQIIPQTKETSSGATVIKVRIILIEPDLKAFVNGLSGESQIIISENMSALYIPIEALQDDSNVVIQEDSQLKSVKVVTGIESDTDIEIKEGLEEGDKVLLNPPASFQKQGD